MKAVAFATAFLLISNYYFAEENGLIWMPDFLFGFLP